MKLPAYPRYKPSGVAWLGDVPEHWGVTRVKRIADVRQGLAKGRDYGSAQTVECPYLRVANVQDGYLDLADIATIAVLPMEVQRFALRTGDVLMNEGGDRDKLGRGAVWSGQISPCLHQNHVFSVRPMAPSLSRWIALWTQGVTAKTYFLLMGNQTTNLASISSTSISELPVPVPPLPEQRAIADFLDRATARIDTLVARKRTLIERLQEKRTALISRTVTRGLPPDAARAAGFDPHPQLKPSGVPWLGDVPEHWEVKRLRHLLAVPLQYGANVSADLDDPDLPRYVRITDIHEDGSLRDETFRSLPRPVAEPYMLEDGDILFARSGATAGKTFLYRRSWGACAYAGYLIRGRMHPHRAVPAFVKCFTCSTGYWQWVSSICIQATIQNVSAEKYADLQLALPPLPEQRAIAAYLDAETAKLDALAAKVEKAIERLQEYRTALITAAVTGKVDVRGGSHCGNNAFDSTIGNR